MVTESRYELIEDSHGEGGFGKVSKRRDVILERLVAVKELHIDDSEAQERFKREAKTLARMSHPSVPAIYDVQFDEGMSILFEFIDGSNLRSFIRDHNFPTIEQVRNWFLQVGAALVHAHSLGIVHRDIKPENIIISNDQSNASLVDFGIALTDEDVQRLTSTGYVIGTPAYMSPEQTAGEVVDARSDMYSLGITLYETLSGRLPTTADYRPLSEDNEAIPPAIDTLIKECLAQNADLRLQSAAEFVTKLGNTLRTDIPLSSLLTDARLHEIVGALQQLSSSEFASKPRGQKLLVINRLKDLLRSDKPYLVRPTAEFVALLVQLAIHEAKSQYDFVAKTAYEWGFDKKYTDSWQGDQPIRDALVAAAKAAGVEAHEVLSNEFVALLSDKNIPDLERWYHHDLRILVTALLANPHCGDIADKLAELYDKINEVSH